MKLKEAIELFEAGEKVRTIEMGGICLSYELAIQQLAFTLAKKGKIYESVFDVDVPEDLKKWGFSGAQVVAATLLSNQFISDYEGLFEKAKRDNKEDRIIETFKISFEDCCRLSNFDKLYEEEVQNG